jgi:hypothetical protein
MGLHRLQSCLRGEEGDEEHEKHRQRRGHGVGRRGGTRLNVRGPLYINSS